MPTSELADQAANAISRMDGSEVIMEGELDKCSDFLRMWRPRYFQLRLCQEDDEKPSIYLYYWTSQEACDESPNRPRGVFHMNKMLVRLGNEREIVCFDHVVQKGSQYVAAERILLLRAPNGGVSKWWLKKLAYAHMMRNYPQWEHRTVRVGSCTLERMPFRFELKSVGRKALLFLWKNTDETPLHSVIPELVCDLNRCGEISSPDDHSVVIEQTRDLMSKFQAELPKCFVYMTVKLGFEDKAEASRVFVLANLRPSNVLIGAVETILSFLLRSSFKRKRMSARRIQIWFRRQQRLRELWSIAAAQLDENENLVDHLVLHDIKDECEVLYKSTDNSFEEMVDQLDLSELSESLEYSSGSPSPDATDRFAPFPVPLTPSHSILLEREEWQSPRPAKLSPVDELKEREAESPQLEPIPQA